jgi:superfamily II DNA or RNA helicase
MVLLGGKKSKRQLLQRIGRGLRKKETDNRIDILDFFDYDGKYLERHSTIRRKIYKKEKFDIEMVRFTGSGLVKVEEKETDFEGAEEE